MKAVLLLIVWTALSAWLLPAVQRLGGMAVAGFFVLYIAIAVAIISPPLPKKRY